MSLRSNNSFLFSYSSFLTSSHVSLLVCHPLPWLEGVLYSLLLWDIKQQVLYRETRVILHSLHEKEKEKEREENSSFSHQNPWRETSGLLCLVLCLESIGSRFPLTTPSKENDLLVHLPIITFLVNSHSLLFTAGDDSKLQSSGVRVDGPACLVYLIREWKRVQLEFLVFMRELFSLPLKELHRDIQNNWMIIWSA